MQMNGEITEYAEHIGIPANAQAWFYYIKCTCSRYPPLPQIIIIRSESPFLLAAGDPCVSWTVVTRVVRIWSVQRVGMLPLVPLVVCLATLKSKLPLFGVNLKSTCGKWTSVSV